MIRYSLWNPGGNITVLVESPVPFPERAQLAAELLRRHPEAEQAGFLLPAENGCEIRLEMAGGEFCGNASLSAAAFCAREYGARTAVRVLCSGVEEPVLVEPLRNTPDLFSGTLRMPGPFALSYLDAFPGMPSLPLVEMPGIAHVIVRGELPEERAETLLPTLCGALGKPALGLLFLEEDRMTPFVYVHGAGTLYREHACASGTAAVGYYLAASAGQSVRTELRQPGGTLSVNASPSGEVRLTGSVVYGGSFSL